MGGTAFSRRWCNLHFMLGSKTQYSLKNAEDYFREHLRVGDYYMEGRSVSGEWMGEGAKRLNLSGVTTEKDFLNLCRNIHPQTNEQLTPRLNGKRTSVDENGIAHEYANRRVFFDFTLSPPKSVSIAALVGNDKRIIEAHDKAIRLAMNQFESFAATRIRTDNQYSHRLTGNLVGAVFRHDTSRALDPHLHSHCILFNATFDSVERRWKALETCEMLPAQKFIENVYYHELAKSLKRFGYHVQNSPRGDFEIEGVSKELIDRFSKRHREIDEKTKELLEREPDKANQNIKVIRANIAHKERARKIKDVGIVKLQSIWNKQLSWKEWWQINRLDKQRSPDTSPKIAANEAVTWAENHLFERRSVVHEHELWRHALEHARGQDFSASEIQDVTRQRRYLRDEQFHGQITTREVMERERRYAQIRTLPPCGQWSPAIRFRGKMRPYGGGSGTVSFQGKYEVLSALSEGEVQSFRARQVSSGRLVLVHHLAAGHTPGLQPDLASLVFLFLRRASVEQSRHLLDMGEDEGRIYIVTADAPECLNLRKWLQLVPEAPAEKGGESQPGEEAPSPADLNTTTAFNAEALRVLFSPPSAPVSPSSGPLVPPVVSTSEESHNALEPPDDIPAASSEAPESGTTAFFEFWENASVGDLAGHPTPTPTPPTSEPSPESPSELLEVSPEFLSSPSSSSAHDSPGAAISDLPVPGTVPESVSAAVPAGEEAEDNSGQSVEFVLTPPEVMEVPATPKNYSQKTYCDYYTS